MKFYYLVAAHNEELLLEKTIHELADIPRRFPGSEVLLLENASRDNTWSMAQKLAQENSSWLSSYHNDEKGIGVAFKRGLRELQKKNLTETDWVIFCAADLPFGFSDLEHFLTLGPDSWKENLLFVGSKRHPHSIIQRNWKRRLGSVIFEVLRYLLLQIKTKDTQGSLILKGDQIGVVDKMRSDDYFFSVEIVYFMEHEGKVTEIPVTLKPDKRPSKVSLVRDGIKTIQQILSFRIHKNNSH